MSYTFRGSLCGYICPDCFEPLANVKVRLYRNRPEQNATVLAVANPKETFAILTDEQVKAKEPFLLAETETDANGNFNFELGEKEHYGGEAFEVDVYCGTVPNLKIGPTPPRPLQFTLTTLQPLWRGIEGQYSWGWEYCLSAQSWCSVRTWFGGRVICGTVVTCDGKEPVAGVKVIALDSDIITTETLGSALTDASGHFRIDYVHPGLLVELFPVLGPLYPHGKGADLYFRIETPGGTVLLSEPPSRGRAPDRDDAPVCFCVELCLDKTPPTGVDTIPLFNKVGSYPVDPADPDFAANGFTADGTTKVGDLAFTSTIPLRGLLPDGDSPDALEYHFTVAEYDSTGTVLGPVSDVEANKIGPTVIGSLEYFYWNGFAWTIGSADYYANNPGALPVTIPTTGAPLSVPRNVTVLPGGWIRVPRENNLTPGGIGRFVGGNVDLIDLDTTKLTADSIDLTTPPPAVNAGDTLTSAQKSIKHWFKLTFEARKVLGAAPVSSNSRDKIAISNTSFTQLLHPNWGGGVVTNIPVLSLNIGELTGTGAGCNDLHDELHALYTVHHPWPGIAQIYFEGPGTLPAPFNLTFSPDGVAVGNQLFDISGLTPCAYILWVSLTLRLTRGFGAVYGTFFDHLAFCKT